MNMESMLQGDDPPMVLILEFKSEKFHEGEQYISQC